MKRIDRMREHTRWRWRLAEVQAKINGDMHDLLRAVDHEGEALDSFASKTRDKAAALSFINRTDNSHQPFRRRERAMLRFRRMKSLQKSASAHGAAHDPFKQERHLTSRETHEANRSAAPADWRSHMA